MITAVILHFRHWPGVIDTIESVRAQTVPLSLLVIDNASNDGSADAIRRRFPDVQVVEAGKNLGYAGGMNLGRALAPHDDMLLLTHDVLLAPDAAEQMQAHLVGDVAMVGPILYYSERPDVVFSSGGFLDRRRVQGHFEDLPANVRDVDWLDGACLLVRSDAFDDVGPMDEGYFLYFEETDFATRLRNAGWRVQCVPAARAWQRPSALPWALFTRNWLRYLSRHHGRGAVWTGVVVTVERALRAVSGRRLTRAGLLFLGLVGYFLRLPPRVLNRP